MNYEVSLKDLRQAGACYSGYNKLVRSIQGVPFTGEDDSRKSYIHHAHDKPIQINSILESNGLDDAIWALRCVKNADRNIRLFGVWCARQVQHLIEDQRAMNALDVAERFANGNASAEALDAAWAAARAAAGDATRDAARDAAWAVAWAAAGAAAGDAALAAARAAAWAAARAAGDSAWAAARAAAEASQEEMFRRMCQGEAEWQTVKALVTH